MSAARWHAVLGLTVLALAGCGGGDEGEDRQAGEGPVIEDPGPIHVHGLGINPADGALFIATHTGLFRAAPNEEKATRVANRYQDTMGFTVVGANRFLGSGHPDVREKLPPFLGLIRSKDAGKSWKPISLLGKADFHVLEAAGDRVYGFGSDFESREQRLLVSDDGGRSWERRDAPEPLLSLAIDPRDTETVVASGTNGLYRSDTGARRWQTLGGQPGLVGWSEAGSLYLVDDSGAVSESSNDGGSWQARSEIGGQPAAFEVVGDDLLVALHNGTIKLSGDGGRSWEIRSQPQAERQH